MRLRGERISLVVSEAQGRRIRELARRAKKASPSELLQEWLDPMLDSDDDETIVFKALALKKRSYEYMCNRYGDAADEILDDLLETAVQQDKAAGATSP